MRLTKYVSWYNILFNIPEHDLSPRRNDCLTLLVSQCTSWSGGFIWFFFPPGYCISLVLTLVLTNVTQWECDLSRSLCWCSCYQLLRGSQVSTCLARKSLWIVLFIKQVCCVVSLMISTMFFINFGFFTYFLRQSCN